ncbi:unnamed protein product [Echinostoma caproni]|uniref:Uncharacterized protein n=1 Tax=Echinostoma caproni TaxID=27848 RepID=A0A3P8HD15_9TREM|nr:unnamed protein product [Echinostoma caproni]
MLEVAKLVIAAGCDTESRNGFTALHLASQDGSPEMTKLLLAAGARVNARAKNDPKWRLCSLGLDRENSNHCGLDKLFKFEVPC